MIVSAMLILVIGGVSCNLIGCSTVSDEQAAANRTTAAAQDAELGKRIDAYAREIGTLHDKLADVEGKSAEEVAALKAQLAAAESTAAQAEAIKAQLAEARAKEANPTPNAGNRDAMTGVNTALDLLPAPFGGLAKLGVGLAGGYFFGTQRGRKQLAGVVGAIDLFVKANPVVAQEFDNKTEEIQRFMGPSTAKAVKKIRRKAKQQTAVLKTA